MIEKALVLTMLIATISICAKDESLFKLHADTWDSYVNVNFPIGTTLSHVANTLHGKFRDTGVSYLGGSGSKIVYYLIDDKIQISFQFDGKDMLIFKPRIEKPGIWLRNTDGSLFSIQSKNNE